MCVPCIYPAKCFPSQGRTPVTKCKCHIEITCVKKPEKLHVCQRDLTGGRLNNTAGLMFSKFYTCVTFTLIDTPETYLEEESHSQLKKS